MKKLQVSVCLRILLAIILLNLASFSFAEIQEKNDAPTSTTQLPIETSKLKWQSAAEDNLNPESAYFLDEYIYVSNVGKSSIVNGDGDGYINKYSLDGKLLSKKWVDRLNDPKGMRAFNGTLWVSDRNELVAINIAVGTIRSRYKIKDAEFLNDVAIDEGGAIFASDTFGSAIYRLYEGKLETFVKGPELESPNGLLVVGENLIVAAWGLCKNFEEKTSGHLYSISLKTKEKTLLSEKPLGNLDGLELLSADLYLLSDWVTGSVFSWNSKTQEKKVILTGLKGPADLGFIESRREIIVPRMGDQLVSAFKL